MDDRALVAPQLGRSPRAFLRVAVRCPFGLPAVTEQRAVRRRPSAVPDDVLRHVSAPGGGGRAARGRRWRRALEPRRCARTRGLAASLARATEEQRRVRRELAGDDARLGRRSVARTRHRRLAHAEPTSSACTPTSPSRSHVPATSSGTRSSGSSASPGRPSAAARRRSPRRRSSLSARARRRRERQAGVGARVPRLRGARSRPRARGALALAAEGGDDRAAAGGSAAVVHAPRARRPLRDRRHLGAPACSPSKARRTGRGRSTLVEGAAFHLYSRGAVDYAAVSMPRALRLAASRAPGQPRGCARCAWCSSSLGVVLAFLLGIAFSRALDERPKSSGVVTRVRTLTPLPQGAPGTTVTVTVTTTSP